MEVFYGKLDEIEIGVKKAQFNFRITAAFKNLSMSLIANLTQISHLFEIFLSKISFYCSRKF